MLCAAIFSNEIKKRTAGRKNFMSDEEFFEKIYDEYANQVYLEIQKLLYSDESDDIFTCKNDTFLKAWEKITKLKKHENIGGWLVLTAQNIAHNFNKKYNVHRNHEVGSNIIEQLTGEGDFTEKIFGELEAEKILACLSSKERNLYDYKYVVGYNNEEIGEMLGITPNAVVKRNKKMIEKLKKIYESKK
jgi:RNA polymerase sigma-70 factor (ECF subfamily)